jgi:hypothetical protein
MKNSVAPLSDIPGPQITLQCQVPELFITAQIPEATVTGDQLTIVIKALPGIAHEKHINFLAGGREGDESACIKWQSTPLGRGRNRVLFAQA